jgi:Uma2 family endonuclease
MAVELKKRLLTTEAYHLMIEAGLLTEDDRVELLHGEIIDMGPIGPKHSAFVRRLDQQLQQRYQGKLQVSVQCPIEATPFSEPEPDLCLLAPREDFYELSHPKPEDVFLVIEVADSSLEKDRQIKLPAYAQAGIPVLWIVNLIERQVEVYTQPTGDRYKLRELALPGDTLSLPELDATLSVDEVLG